MPRHCIKPDLYQYRYRRSAPTDFTDRGEKIPEEERCAIIPLSYALLGLLARESCSGYDLIRRMEEPVGFFWHARRSQIYPELARLEAAGLVQHTLVAQQDRPDKKVYEVTEAGLAALRRWIAAPTKPMLDRDEFMLKVYSSWLVGPEQALALICEHEARHTSRLAHYHEIEARMQQGWAPSERRPDSPKFAAYATLRRGIEYERGYVEWCRWLVCAIEAATEPATEPADEAVEKEGQ